MIDVAKGGSVQGVLDGLNKVIDLAFPEFRHQGGTLVIPGHGRLGDVSDVAIYRNMVEVVRDRVQELIKQGMSLQQVKAAKPTLDYDGIYGSPDAFIEAVYQSLTKKYRRGKLKVRSNEHKGTQVSDDRGGRCAGRLDDAGPARRRRGGSASNSQAAAAIDLTGTWVSVISEDWPQRMLPLRKAITPESRSPPPPARWPIPGIRARRSGRRAVQRVHGRRDHADAGAYSSDLAGRLHDEDGARGG